MFSNSSSEPNPNPNPKIPRPSSSIKPVKFKRKNINSQNQKKINMPMRMKKKEKMKNRNWLDLPDEIWFMILSKINTIDIIENVQLVCTMFHNFCKQPTMFKVIDMTVPNDDYLKWRDYVNAITQIAVDRSSGCLIDIYLENLCDEATLWDVVWSSKNLKHLRLGHHVNISDRDLVEAVKVLPMLEELELIICCFYNSTIEVVGRACPSLKSFSLNAVCFRDDNYTCNYDVMAIARSMPNLRNLQLIGSCMTNEGLKAILDGCPLLDSLDLRSCFRIDLSGELGKRCEQIKHFRKPNDSIADYRHQVCKCDEDDGSPSGHLYCRKITAGGASYPEWDDDLEYIDPDHVDEDRLFGYDNVDEIPEYIDYGQVDQADHAYNVDDYPELNKDIEFTDNDDMSYDMYYSPLSSPEPERVMDYDEFLSLL
ncbi:putative F-box/LRR-repeat protein 23 [Spinacia oleracea]|uniref:F-box/LRR-repeat protein 23 n=1 Tax=Spinacia oleracea TaxID=3562 RepID=A0A9R0K8S3_SPIOL|nr:putative F-box/LRR-repeat protein 23 [Spinacia oleracea]